MASRPCASAISFSGLDQYISMNVDFQNDAFYQQIFAHRFNIVMVATLVVFMGDLFSQRSRLLQGVQRDADTDPLTRLRNRSFVLRIIKDLAVRPKIGIAVLDIDNFEKINDGYGHHVGDEVIIAVSNIIRRCVRKTDIAVRWGGEEFLVILPGISTENLKLVCNRIIEEARHQRVSFDGQEIRFTVSVGVTHIEDFVKQDFGAAFSNADALLYEAKQTGKDKSVFGSLVNRAGAV